MKCMIFFKKLEEGDDSENGLCYSCKPTYDWLRKQKGHDSKRNGLSWLRKLKKDKEGKE